MAHWELVADAAHKNAYYWVVVRHEIDYLRAAVPGYSDHGPDRVGEAPKGARFDRHMEFSSADGKAVCPRQDRLGDHRQGAGAADPSSSQRWWRRSWAGE